MDNPIATLDRPGHRGAQMRYIALASLTGILTGAVGSVFHLMIDRLQTWPHLLSAYVDGASLVVAAALITMCITLLAVYVVRRYAPEAGGSGVQEIEGAMQGLRVVRWRRVLPVKFFAGIAAVGSGLVLGREGPTIHIGASFSAAITDFFKVSEIERRGMLGAGAAAGLACAFDAPLAAVLFIVEETRRQFPYTFRTYMGVIVAAFLATVMTQIIGGTAPDLSMLVDSPAVWMLPAFVLLGCLLGVLGVTLNAGLLWTSALAARVNARASYLFPAVVGLAIGALFIVMPMAVTGGDSVIKSLAAGGAGLKILLMLAVLRFVTMVTSYSAGTPGGIFAPMLALSMCVGLAFGEVMTFALPHDAMVPLAFGIAAMGGLFSASVRAPVVGVALTLELTGSYTMVMPLIATCVTANMVAQWIGGRPIYDLLLEKTLMQAGIDPGKKGEDSTGLA
ncbi:H(+)/Cl(-) exchange transporter ClcA [Nitratireductor aquimarinus]|uniref:H(+)/Cl(-) exchange transporter ClcA n=1 Tax=Nitratireductor aquimarinus TaxID=889300 RepID=A0ABU4AP80_9HYPH|nr:H(+)/Cl(-) exchange transporter ClcA [Nitratireductor aquimarinus]MDV6228047.1 H(+)/Cl(-) exchange transporter ClcA [Nitratireductor aquimarinus]